MTSPDGGEDRTMRTWAKRVVTLVVVWAALWVFTSWLQMRPRPVDLLAVLGIVFAIGWWARDRSSGWDTVEWAGNPVGRRLKATADTRISYLRRLIDDSAVRNDDGKPTTSAISLQGVLRDVAVDRLRTRAAASGHAHLPDDADLIAHTDPTLAAYLLAQPPPPTTRQTVTDIINRIEAL